MSRNEIVYHQSVDHTNKVMRAVRNKHLSTLISLTSIDKYIPPKALLVAIRHNSLELVSYICETMVELGIYKDDMVVRTCLAVAIKRTQANSSDIVSKIRTVVGDNV